MSYPPVIQFEARALEAEAQARLARERRAARALQRAPISRRQRRQWLPLWRPGARTAERAPS